MSAWLLVGIVLTQPASGPLAQLHRLDRKVAHLERRSERLQERQRQLRAQVASLTADIAAAEVRVRRAWERFEQRFRALAKMPPGARLALLGSSGSLRDYLRDRRVLTRIAQYDRKLANTHQQAKRRLRELRAGLAERQRKLDALAEQLQTQRAKVAEQRSDRLAFLAELFASPKRLRRLARSKRRARAVLQRMFGRLRPTQPLREQFADNRGRLPWPTLGRIGTRFGQRVELTHGTATPHLGVDILAAAGTPVFAVAAGRVAYADWLEGYGQVVILDHGKDFYTVYAHLGEINTDRDASVAPGALVGSVGNTGSLRGTLLYFEIRRGDVALDPLAWLRPSNGRAQER